MTRLPVWLLFVLAVGIWGTTWHVILYQLAHATPEFGVTLRFGLAGLMVLTYAVWRGERVPRRAGVHGLLALQGLFMYTLAYLCVYHAEHHVPSGLVAVGYSASPLLSGLAAYALWRTPITRRFVAGGVLGLLGVGLIFWPQIAQAGARPTAAWGLVFTLGAVALSTVGSLAASRNAHHEVPFWAGMGTAMLYGAAGSAVAMMLMGQPLQWPAVLSWWVSLLYLAGAGTVVAFAAFLILQQRVGVGPAGAVGVMTPVLALTVSTFFEGYRPDGWTLAGALLAIAGNVLMLRPMKRRDA